MENDPGDLGAVRLPERYGRDHVTLMVRDPHWIFAYWEASDPDATLTVCRQEVGGQSFTPILQTQVPQEGEYYVRVPHAGSNYIAFLSSEGGETLTSAMVTTPRGSVSSVEDETRGSVDELLVSSFQAPPGATSPGFKGQG